MIEEWRAIPGLVGSYEVSNHGRVRSLPRFVEYSDGKVKRHKGRIRKLRVSRLGYHSVDLWKDGSYKEYYVHRLVLKAFVGPCPPKHEACHFPDGDRSNNRLDNLKWVTHKENEGHKKIHGTDNAGGRHYRVKLTQWKVKMIRRLYASGGWTMYELGRDFGVDHKTVRRVINRFTWKHVT